MSEEDNRKRNAKAKQHQHHSNTKIAEREQFDHVGLTKRNAEYMYKFKQELSETKLEPEKQATKISEMVDELKKAQKRGVTAKNLYGTVTQKVELTIHPPKKPQKLTPMTYVIDATYNFLWFLVLFCFLYAAMFFINSSQASKGGVMGITGIFVSSIVAGVGMPLMTNLFAPGVKHKYNGIIRALMMVLLFAIWMLVFFGGTYIPRIINPITGPIVDTVIGVIGIAGILYMRHRFPITNGLFTGNRN
ncbi:DUF1129 family protein [Fructilactobacillus fructivorans]|uniref:DUF1129 family protein n=1 Tax=Fructilactobacillus fructivorans TaxID=1614 RepID=UPI000704AE59|nr:DUF1129 family protein [Fructilactobacillus fructivorans]KRN42947.1 hypothetical protein IV48_GL000975 [Fructilactobacillus fructivorans]